MNTLKLVYRVPRHQRMTLMAVTVFVMSFAMFFSGLGAWSVYILALGICAMFFLPDLISLVATYYLQDSQPDVALKLCDLALDLEPNNYFSLVNCGVAYLKMHEPQDAIKLFERAIALEDKKALGYSNRAFAYYLLKDFKKSEMDGLKATELNPHAAHGHLNYTAALIGQARYSDALAALNEIKSAGRYREHACLQRLLCKIGLHRLEEAEEEWLSAGIKAKFFQHFARCYLAWNKAEYAEVLSLSSEYHDGELHAETILYFRAISYAYLGESELAYKAAYSLFMQKAHTLLGMEAMLVILSDTRFDTIILDLADRVEALHPESFQMLLARLLLALEADDLVCAESFMQKLEQAISTSTVAKSYRALLALKNSNVEDAFKLAKECTLLKPKEGLAWSVLSQIQLAQGNKADALTSIKTALDLLPYHHRMHNQLAQVYEAMGQQAEAKAAREKSISLRDKYESGITKAIREQPMLLSDTDSGVAFDTLLAMDKNLS